MEITLAELADFASNTNDGKLNIFGIIKHIRTAVTPILYPHMVLVLMIKFSPGEKGTNHTIQVVAVDEDGKPILPSVQAQFSVPNTPGPDLGMNVIMGIGGTPFAKFGTYRFDILVDNQSKAEVPVTVVAVPSTPQNQPPRLP